MQLYHFLVKLANKGYQKALGEDKNFLAGLNVHKGDVTYKAVADVFGLRIRRTIKSYLNKLILSFNNIIFHNQSIHFSLRKQSKASSGLLTIGSFSLKEVFKTIGTLVNL